METGGVTAGPMKAMSGLSREASLNRRAGGRPCLTLRVESL